MWFSVSPVWWPGGCLLWQNGWGAWWTFFALGGLLTFCLSRDRQFLTGYPVLLWCASFWGTLSQEVHWLLGGSLVLTAVFLICHPDLLYALDDGDSSLDLYTSSSCHIAVVSKTPHHLHAHWPWFSSACTRHGPGSMEKGMSTFHISAGSLHKQLHKVQCLEQPLLASLWALSLLFPLYAASVIYHGYHKFILCSALFLSRQHLFSTVLVAYLSVSDLKIYLLNIVHWNAFTRTLACI